MNELTTEAEAAPVPAIDAVPAIELCDLRKSFGTNEVLKGIHLRVAERQVVCIIGASGSGKSTLLRCVNRLEEPTGGQVLIDGIDITHPDCDLDLVRRDIGMVFQQFNLFPHLTALGNVTMAQRKVLKRSEEEATSVARAVLERVGLSEKADAYPSQLSGGQQQRVAIARALANDPKVVLADEPTAALDHAHGEPLLDLMARLARETGAAFLIASHDPMVLDRADEVHRLRDGRLEAAP